MLAAYEIYLRPLHLPPTPFPPSLPLAHLCRSPSRLVSAHGALSWNTGLSSSCSWKPPPSLWRPSQMPAHPYHNLFITQTPIPSHHSYHSPHVLPHVINHLSASSLISQTTLSTVRSVNWLMWNFLSLGQQLQLHLGQLTGVKAGPLLSKGCWDLRTSVKGI